MYVVWIREIMDGCTFTFSEYARCGTRETAYRNAIEAEREYGRMTWFGGIEIVHEGRVI